MAELLGAVGSVVGIAGFGLQLAQFLDGFVTEFRAANESLNDVRVSIYAVNRALGQVLEFLEKEKKHVIGRGHKAQLFSNTGLDEIRSTAEQCLKIFWKVEATILNKDHTRDLDRKLSEFYAAIQDNKEPPKLGLDAKKLNKRQSFMWAFHTGRKLEGYKVQLQQLQTPLILMLQVISIRANLTEPHPGLENVKNIEISAQYIRYMAGQSDYQDLGMNPPPPYPTPPRPPWMDDYEYSLQFGTRVGSMKERRSSVKHPPTPHVPKPPRRRRRSESESLPRGRTRRRHTHHEMAEPKDIRAQSSPASDTQRNPTQRKHRSPHDSHGPIPKTDTAAQLISDKLEAAKQHIAKTQPNKKEPEETANGEAVKIPPVGKETTTRLSNMSPLHLDVADENLSTVPQAGSPLETVIGPSKSNPVKRPSIYISPFVTDQPSELSSPETIRQTQTTQMEAGSLDLDLDSATEYNQSTPIIENISVSPMQLPEPDLEPTALLIPLLSSTNEQLFSHKQIAVEPAGGIDLIRSSDLSSQLMTSNSAGAGSVLTTVGVSDHNIGRPEEKWPTPSFNLLSPFLGADNIPQYCGLEDNKQSAVPVSGPIAPPPETGYAADLYNPEDPEQFSISVVDSVESPPILEASHLSPLIAKIAEVDPPEGIEGLIEANSVLPALEHPLETTRAEEEHQSQESLHLNIRENTSISSLLGALQPDFQVSSTVEAMPRPESNVTKPSGDAHVLSAPLKPSLSSSNLESAEHNLEALAPSDSDISALVVRAKVEKALQTVPTSPSAGAEDLQPTTNLAPSSGKVSVIVPSRRLSQETVQGPLPATDQIRRTIVPPENYDAISEISEKIPKSKQQIHITLSGRPAWERPAIFETSPWTDTVFAPGRPDFNVTSSFENLTLSAFGSEGNSTISLSGASKKELVIETLKRMCRRDFVTEDDLEAMYPGVGCFITAFTIRGDTHHQIPYTGQFSLRKTHLYSSNPKWWKDFAFLSPEEMSSLSRIVTETEDYARSLVLLKWLRKERLKFWSTKRRVLVAIIYNEPITPFTADTEGDSQISGETPVVPASSYLISRENMPRLEADSGAAAAVQGDSPSICDSQDGNSKSVSIKTGSAGSAMLYAAFTIRVFDPHNLHGNSNSVIPTAVKEGFSQLDIARRIRELNRENSQLIRKKLSLLEVQQDQIAKVLDALSAAEQDSGYVWNLMQLEEIDGPSKGLRVVTIYLHKTSSASIADDFMSEHHQTAPETSGILERESGNNKQEDAAQTTEVFVKKISDATKTDQAGSSVPTSSVVTPRPSTVNFEQKSKRKQRRKSRDARTKTYGSEESSDDDSDESNTSVAESTRKKKAARRQKKTSNRKRDQSLEKSKQKVFDDPQPPWGSFYPPYYNGSPPFPSYPYPPPLPSPYLTSYPSMGPPYSLSNSMPLYSGISPPYGYNQPYDPNLVKYSMYYPPQSPPSDWPSTAPPAGAGYFNTMPSQAPAPPPAPTAASATNFEPEVETRSERLRKASVRKATIRQPLPLHSQAENPISSYTAPPPSVARRRQSYYDQQQALPTPSYAGVQSSHSRYGATPSAPPISRSAFAMPAPSSSYPYPPRRTPMPYPEFYDGRSYDPFAPLTEDERNNTNDIVQKLLLDWTPAGDELKKKREKEMEGTEEEEQEDAMTDQETSNSRSRSGWRGKYRNDSSDNIPETCTAKARPAYVDEVDEFVRPAQGSAKKKIDKGKKVESEQGSHGSTRAEVSRRTKPEVSQRRGSEFRPKDKGKERVKDESRFDDRSSSDQSRRSNFRPASITSVD